MVHLPEDDAGWIKRAQRANPPSVANGNELFAPTRLREKSDLLAAASVAEGPPDNKGMRRGIVPGPGDAEESEATVSIWIRYLVESALEYAGDGQPPGEVMIEPCADAANPDWLALRQALWPDTSPAEHRAEMKALCADPERYAQFLAVLQELGPIGFAEASLRRDYVNGTDSSPVGFLEGIYVVPQARRQGVAGSLLRAVEAWARDRGCRELASDTPIDNRISQLTHRALGFSETDRVVFFRKPLAEDPEL